jgi:ribosomal protein S6--L-glutamate ligase
LIQEAKAIILPQACPEKLYQACTRSSATVFPNYRTRFQYPGKTGQSILFKKTGTAHPETKIWRSVHEFRQEEGLPHNIPFFLKTDQGHEADGIYFVTDRQALDSALDILARSGTSGFVSQEFISAHGNVLRIVVMGRKSIIYWKRPSSPDQIITTAGRNGIIDRDWRPDLQKKGEFAVKNFSNKTGIDLAAIDCIFPLDEDNPQPMLLEINYYFGRRGLGGSINYYSLLFQTVRDWLFENSLDPGAVSLV